MMRFKLYDDSRVICVFDVENVDENKRIDTILQELFMSEYDKPDFFAKVNGDDGLAKYVINQGQSFYINLQGHYLTSMYDIDSNGVIFWRQYSLTRDGFWTISSLRKMKEYGLLDWDGKSINFSVAKGGLGAGAGGIDPNFIVTLLTSPYVTAALNLANLVEVAVEISHLTKAKSKENGWEQIFNDFLVKGFYPTRLLELVMLKRIWKVSRLQKLLNVKPKENVEVLLAACGYQQSSRTEWTREDSEWATEQRLLWKSNK
ncbi:hypothetical protein [Leuconostoc mesenteroides]|uniref:hypothetical protein n=1 Tax=Leuconostoc mesenteroides TaxID=1245 RepID=UPI00385F9193